MYRREAIHDLQAKLLIPESHCSVGQNNDGIFFREAAPQSAERSIQSTGTGTVLRNGNNSRKILRRIAEQRIIGFFFIPRGTILGKIITGKQFFPARSSRLKAP